MFSVLQVIDELINILELKITKKMYNYSQVFIHWKLNNLEQFPPFEQLFHIVIFRTTFSTNYFYLERFYIYIKYCFTGEAGQNEWYKAIQSDPHPKHPQWSNGSGNHPPRDPLWESHQCARPQGQEPGMSVRVYIWKTRNSEPCCTPISNLFYVSRLVSCTVIKMSLFELICGVGQWWL